MIPIPILTDEQKEFLKISDAITYLESSLGLSCRLGLYVISWTFYRSENQKEVFKTNPMNTFGASLLQKSLEKSAIDLFSEIDSLLKRLGIDRKAIVGMAELMNHRHYQAHSYMEKFDFKNVEAFVKSGMHHTDDIGLRIWQVRSNILQLMIKNKVPVPPSSILRVEMSQQQADLVNDILKQSTHSGERLPIETLISVSKFFSAVLMAQYTHEFQEEFKKLYSEGPLIM